MNIKDAFFADKSRWISGIGLALAAFVVVFSGSLPLFWSVLGIVYIRALFEAARFLDIEKDPFIYIFAFALWLLALFFPNPLDLALLALLLLSIPSIFHIKNFQQIAKLIIYPTIPFLAIISLYATQNSPEWLMLLLFMSVAMADMGAYFGGRLYGKRKLAPDISPNKTIEGALFGLIAGTVVGTLIALFIFSNIYISIALAFLITFFSIVGDLFESYIKRLYDKKDSGSIFPGHGGVLDRVDGVMFGGVVLYIALGMMA